MHSKHIALIHTGGTIGMEKTARGYAPMPDFARRLSGALGDMASAGIVLPRHTLHEFIHPIDSANSTPADWQKIARELATLYAAHDGFVVLHGTDTMAYTATALSFMLQGLRKPVILTGAQRPLGEPDSDALSNLTAALRLAASDSINEVAIFFNRRLLRGNRSSKRSAQDVDAFESPNYPSLAEVGTAIELHVPALLPRLALEKFELPNYEAGKILSLQLTPGMPVAALEALLALQPRALILECYGAGNAPDQDAALLNALNRATASGVVLIACSQVPHGRVALGTYATGTALARTGAIGALDMTFEAIFVKLHHLFALGLRPDAVRTELLRDWCGELTV
ncbi:asparaginase [soil metagenome]